MDYSCTASVYYSPTTRILLLTSLWWYTARHCWRCSSSPTESLLLERISWSSIPNEPISLPSHLSKTEKSLYTELIMFSKLPPGVEPGTIHQKWIALPLSYDSMALFFILKNKLEECYITTKVFILRTAKLRNCGHRSQTYYFMGMNHAWFTYSFHSPANAVWRIRTSKSFPTDRLATGSNTIMGIRRVLLNIPPYIKKRMYLFEEGVPKATLGKLVE